MKTDNSQLFETLKNINFLEIRSLWSVPETDRTPSVIFKIKGTNLYIHLNNNKIKWVEEHPIVGFYPIMKTIKFSEKIFDTIPEIYRDEFLFNLDIFLENSN